MKITVNQSIDKYLSTIKSEKEKPVCATLLINNFLAFIKEELIKEGVGIKRS